MTSEQMQGFYGWKHALMLQENISTSRSAIMQIFLALGSFEFGKPEMEVLVVDNVEAKEEGVGSGFL
jgi:hypothetical protein